MPITHNVTQAAPDAMPSPLARLRAFRENLKSLIDGRQMEARAEQGRARPVSPLASTMPVSMSNSGANREGFARLHSLSDRVSSIKTALEDIVNGRAYTEDLRTEESPAISSPSGSERSGGALSSIKPTVHLNRHGSVDILLPSSVHR